MTKQIETDIAVIGAGSSGLAAAVAAAERGAGVAVFEKASATGGTGNMAMGLFAVESRLQRERQIALNREEAFKVFMDYTHWRVDARLVRAYIDKSADTIDWLGKMGIEFSEPATYFPGSNFTWHIIKTNPKGSGLEAAGIMMKNLAVRANELGVKIYLNTPAGRIIKKGNQVSGLVAEDRSGENIEVNAKAVIIGTGGFGDNPDMIKKYTGYEWGRDLHSFRIPGMAGEGIRMAWEAGAAQGDMNMELTFDMPIGPEGPQYIPVHRTLFHQPGLMVNLSGERFYNEALMGNTTFTGNAISKQKDRRAFIIFDEATIRFYEEKGWDFIASHVRQAFGKGIAEDVRKTIGLGNKNVYMADSIEQLASQAGINAGNLKKTVDEYNHACEMGRDGLFNKDYRYLHPVKEPKFYAGLLLPSGYGTLGGIKINYRTEVLNKAGELIPGLYAVGTDANSLYGDSYVFVLPGNTLGFAVNSGRMAGENAAEYIKNIK